MKFLTAIILAASLAVVIANNATLVDVTVYSAHLNAPANAFVKIWGINAPTRVMVNNLFLYSIICVHYFARI